MRVILHVEQASRKDCAKLLRLIMNRSPELDTNDNLMKYIGYVEITAGLGLSVGPLLGGLLFTDLDYTGTLFFFGGINFFVLLLCQYLIPNEINNSDSENS